MNHIRLLAFILALLSCITVSAFGQIPNAGFENWSGDTLTGWWSNNVAPLYSTISSSATAHGGSHAVRGNVVAFYTQAMQPIIQSGTDARGFPCSQRPTSFTGYYEFFPVASSGDRFGVNVALYKGGLDGTPVALAAAALSTPVSSYTQFTATFNYLTSDVPDTCVIQLQIVGPGTGQQATPAVGSYFLLDDIAFTGASGVADKRVSVPAVFQLHQNYPNPFNPTTNIAFSVPGDGRATLTISNLLGQRVAGIYDGAVSAGKTYRMTFNGLNLPSGIYFSRLQFLPEGSNGQGGKC
jgi:hypothetical protein